ncbi:hypothetical protein [Mesobacillus selenatarsenatis]|uniref:Uncharacterized protein n=1 Tax=Mesobacillus selenatarsenatis (strain DSM 18680 / JCM 14380 / FERM P-15431 / SF-1) TaxID=1321606 RepID=A0A0A8WZ37_MESS1|nr:hypothetical protein [Mesobacillus selenatarsenatis]GAM12254.1 hypothetical protein SAMD00020551_0386 [Mesobacillus selenatarsenatis SF-1]
MRKKIGPNVLVILLTVVIAIAVRETFFTPKNSLELYQEVTFANDFEEVQKLILDGYDSNIERDDLDYIKGRSANRVGQFTLIEYKEKSFVIMTSPGTARLKILAVEELPEDIREYFLKMGQ